MTNAYDVVIIGAGPVGSAAASIGARHGLRCALVDQSTEVVPEPRAIHFDADIMRIFQFAGLADRIELITRATTGGVHLGVDGNPIRSFRVGDEPGDFGWQPHYMFSQPELEALLRTAAAERHEIDTFFGWRCTALEQDDDRVTVTLSSADGAIQRVGGRYGIAADGAASSARKALAIGLSDYGFDEPWVIADADVDDPSLGPDYTIMYCDPSRPGTYVPGPGVHRRWEFMLLPGETGSEFETREGIVGLITPISPWLDPGRLALRRVAVYRFHALVAERWRRGRMFLAGDAAHQTPPFYGQGMCHGMRDARNLLWKIADVIRARASEQLLDTYQAEREPHVRAIIEAAVTNGRYICTLDPDLAAKRDSELRERMSQGADVRSFREVIPGLQRGLLDKLPPSEPTGLLFVQPWEQTANGSRRLFDVTLGDGWSLIAANRLLCEATRQRAADLDVEVIDVGDEDGAFGSTLAEWFATFRCAAALIRPDRYVYGTANSCAELAQQLQTLFEQLRAPHG